LQQAILEAQEKYITYKEYYQNTMNQLVGLFGKEAVHSWVGSITSLDDAIASLKELQLISGSQADVVRTKK
jgi:hypothetical protein